MTDTLTGRARDDIAARPDPGSVLLDAERLDVYRVAREFYALSCTFSLTGEGELRDQLRRGALSIFLNTAEGAGRSSSADRKRFFTMARGSAMECAAILDAIGLRGLAPEFDRRRGRALLVRTVQMLTRLQQHAG